VAEELRVDQLRGDRAAVHAAERAVLERRRFVDGTRDDLLAGAGLSEQEDRDVAARDEAGAGHDGRKPGVAADQPLIAGTRIRAHEIG
jgi:hypothetical protein